MNMNNFHYDFKENIKSITTQHMFIYEKDLLKILQDNPNIIQIDAFRKLLNLNTSITINICTSLLKDYHKELMKFLESK